MKHALTSPPSVNSPEPPWKRVKVDEPEKPENPEMDNTDPGDITAVSIETMQNECIARVEFSFEHLKVRIGVGHQCWIFNPTESDLRVPAHKVFLSYHKGSWSHPKSKKKEETTEFDVVYALADATQLVWLKGKPQTLGSVIVEQRKTNPAANICYHEVHEDPQPGCPWHFTLKQTGAGIIFKTVAAPLNATASSAASMVPASKWDDRCVCIAWHVHWLLKGLSPIRPVVITTKELHIKSGCALKLTH